MPYASRILVPTDFGPLSALALDHAVALALLCRASIHLVHVHADGSPPAQGSEPRLTALVGRCCADGLVMTSQVCTGQPADTIVRVAEDRAVDLIVLGTHGRQGLAHLMLGSVAEQVVRTAPCAVLTVRGRVPERIQLPAQGAWEPLAG